MGWAMENMGLKSSPDDDPLVYDVRFFDDTNRGPTEQQVDVRIPAGTAKPEARELALAQVREQMQRVKAQEQSRQLLPLGIVPIPDPPAMPRSLGA